MNTDCIFFNQSFDKKRLKSLIEWVLKRFGEKEALRVVEELKTTGFVNATRAGISLGLHELLTPPEKSSLLSQAQVTMKQTDHDFNGARITATERSQRIVDTWHRVSESLRKQVVEYFSSYDQLNPIYIMALSGARGNFSQVRQLVGMRGLMADPQGKIISFPIRSNLREGLTLTEYFISCSGARKGLVDTALRTADTGYLTRRLVDVSHHVVVKRVACDTHRGMVIHKLQSNNKTLLSLKDRLIGRVLAENIFVDNKHILNMTGNGELLLPVLTENSSNCEAILAKKDQEISPDLASYISLIRQQVVIRSPLTCAFHHEICQLCYGWSLSQGNLVALGEAVGVIAAQSIGEPGTQLTMRTFHTGGVFSGDVLQEIRAPHSGKIHFSQAFQGLLIRNTHGTISFLTKVPGEMIVRAESSPAPHYKQNQSPTGSGILSQSPDSSDKDSLKREETLAEQNMPSAKQKFVLGEMKMSNRSKDLLKTVQTHVQKKNTRIAFQALSMLFVRQGEKVEKNQLLAELSHLKEERNQPITSQQTIFAELSGTIIDVQGGSLRHPHFEKEHDQNEENKSLHQIEPDKSGTLGLFHIISTRIGATFNPCDKRPDVHFFQTGNTASFLPDSALKVYGRAHLDQASTHVFGKQVRSSDCQSPIGSGDVIPELLSDWDRIQSPTGSGITSPEPVGDWITSQSISTQGMHRSYNESTSHSIESLDSLINSNGTKQKPFAAQDWPSAKKLLHTSQIKKKFCLRLGHCLLAQAVLKKQNGGKIRQSDFNISLQTSSGHRKRAWAGTKTKISVYQTLVKNQTKKEHTSSTTFKTISFLTKRKQQQKARPVPQTGTQLETCPTPYTWLQLKFTVSMGNKAIARAGTIVKEPILPFSQVASYVHQDKMAGSVRRYWNRTIVAQPFLFSQIQSVPPFTQLYFEQNKQAHLFYQSVLKDTTLSLPPKVFQPVDMVPSDFLYLRTLAEEGDLVNEGYKNYKQS